MRLVGWLAGIPTTRRHAQSERERGEEVRERERDYWWFVVERGTPKASPVWCFTLSRDVIVLLPGETLPFIPPLPSRAIRQATPTSHTCAAQRKSKRHRTACALFPSGYSKSTPGFSLFFFSLSLSLSSLLLQQLSQRSGETQQHGKTKTKKKKKCGEI